MPYNLPDNVSYHDPHAPWNQSDQDVFDPDLLTEARQTAEHLKELLGNLETLKPLRCFGRWRITKMLRVNTDTMTKMLCPATMANDRLDKLEAVLSAAKDLILELEILMPGCTVGLCPGLIKAIKEVGDEQETVDTWAVGKLVAKDFPPQ